MEAAFVCVIQMGGFSYVQVLKLQDCMPYFIE
jgi:hypothetical protein